METNNETMEVREMRRVLTLTQTDDGRYKIVASSDFVYADEIDMTKLDPERHSVVFDYAEPLRLEGKIAESFYDRKTGKISVEYRGVNFNDYPLPMQITTLKKENDELKADNILLGQQITEMELKTIELEVRIGE